MQIRHSLWFGRGSPKGEYLLLRKGGRKNLQHFADVAYSSPLIASRRRRQNLTREQRSERAALPRRDRRYVIETARERASAKGEERGERGGNLSRNFFFLPVNVCGGCVAFGRTPVYLSLAALSASPSLPSSLSLPWMECSQVFPFLHFYFLFALPTRPSRK